ncbi:hypothetical protein [Klebsiella quasipneumoniae]
MTLAATELHVTHGAISRQIRKLGLWPDKSFVLTVRVNYYHV